MTSPSEQEQLEWGRELGTVLAGWPRLRHLCENAGIPVDPAKFIPTIIHGMIEETAPLAALLTLIENAMTHHALQAEEENHEWNRKTTALQEKIDAITTALTKAAIVENEIRASWS